MKHSWQLINNLIGKNKKSNNISQLKCDGTVISDDITKAEAFNDFFINIGMNLATENGSHVSPNTSSRDWENSPVKSSTNVNFKFHEISLEEVIWQLRNLKTSKATGIDNIPAKVLKISAEVVGPALTWIYNLSIKTGIYVDEWKKAWVMPIFKSEDRQKCENYRPISILPIISKILERLIFYLIYKFLNDNSVLSKFQSGFRPKHSTLTSLIQMCDTLYENMDNGRLNGVVFLDMRKAFDSINHNILLQKMNTQFGIKNLELEWFKSYLNNREQVCVVNGKTSSAKKIMCGVQQSSILGPLLFLLYINDLPECLDKTSPYLYADDTQILSSANDIEELTENLNNDFKKLSEWLDRNKLQHHPTKTKLMFIGSKHNTDSLNCNTPVLINNQPITRVLSFKCLGVKLDENLNWDEHVEMICNKVGAGI